MSSINCEDIAEFVKVKATRRIRNLKNMQSYFLAGEFYKNSAEHLEEELARVGVLIQILLEKTGSEAGENNQDFVSLFISEAEANSIIQAVSCSSEACGAQGLKSEELRHGREQSAGKKL